MTGAQYFSVTTAESLLLSKYAPGASSQVKNCFSKFCLAVKDDTCAH